VVGEFDAGTEEVARLTAGLAPVRGATGPEWEVEGGDWTVVIMNADASPGIDTNARVGIKIDWLLPVAIVLIVVGVVMLVGGILLAVFVGRRPRQQPVLAPAGATTLPPPAGPGTPRT